MWIRDETPADHEAISRVIEAAFAAAPHASGREARIVESLREAEAMSLSRVADIDGRVVGQVTLSEVTLDSDGNRSDGWFGLGPIAVDPAHQRHGVGSALVRAALAELPALGARGCVVLGDPDYYTRFGFAPVASLRYEGAPAKYFLALVVGDGDVPNAQVTYHPAFSIA